MYIEAKYDPEWSLMVEKIMFSCKDFELHRQDIEDMKKKKLIKLVQSETLPDPVPCQVVVYFETWNKARIIFFDPEFIMHEEVYAEPFMNKDLIDRSEKNTGFWIECTVPLHNDCINLDFSYTI